MSIAFTLSERLAGVLAQSVEQGGTAMVLCREQLTSFDGMALPWRLDSLESGLFSKIPGLPPRAQIDNLVVVIDQDLKAIAYVNDLQGIATVRTKTPKSPGEPVFVTDILEMLSFDLGIEVPATCALVVVRSHLWRKALFYDFCPILPDQRPRAYDLGAVLAQQTLTLLSGQFGVTHPSVATMQGAIVELDGLLAARCEDEAEYQRYFQRYPWVLGAQHTAIDRHTHLDDENIPDFTGVRATDRARDIVEIKQPFLPCFRQDGNFTADFNDAWNQTERYLTFTLRNRDYLKSQKSLTFENPRAFLIIGHALTELQLRSVADKAIHTPTISVLTYEQVLRLARALRDVTAAAAEQWGGLSALR